MQYIVIPSFSCAGSWEKVPVLDDGVALHKFLKTTKCGSRTDIALLLRFLLCVHHQRASSSLARPESCLKDVLYGVVVVKYDHLRSIALCIRQLEWRLGTCNG